MSEVWITKTGFRATEWSSDVRQNLDKPIHHIFHELRSTCHIEEGVTLGDIFAAVSRWPDLVGLLGHYCWCDVEAFHAEALTPAVKASELTVIELSKAFEIGNHHSGEDIDVHGIGPNKDGNEIQNWAIDFIPVNELRDVPVRLNRKMRVRDNREGFREIAEVDCSFSLLEVLGEIYYEISFYGSPSQRDATGDTLRETAEEVESGRTTLAPKVMRQQKPN